MSLVQVIPISAPPQAWKTRGPVVVSVPGEKVSALQCAVPPKLNGRKAQSVALQAVQDMIATPRDQTVQVVLPGTGPTRTVLVTDAASLEGWLAIRKSRTPRALALLPDYLCLPWDSETLTVSVPEPSRIVVRTGESTGFAGERKLVLQMLEQARAKLQDVTRVISVTPDAALEDAELMEALSRWAVDIKPAQGAADPPKASLLAGQSREPALGPRTRRYGALVVASVLAALLWVANTEIDTRRIDNSAAALRTANLAFVRDEMHVTGPIVDLRIQVERAIDGMRQASGDNRPGLLFPDLLALVGPVLAAPTVTLEELRYRDATLELAIETADFAELEEMRGMLEAAGVSVDIVTSVGDGEGGVRAELRVTEVKEGR